VSSPLIEEGLAALRAGDAAAARRSFERAVVDPGSGAAPESLAESLYLAQQSHRLPLLPSERLQLDQHIRRLIAPSARIPAVPHVGQFRHRWRDDVVGRVVGATLHGGVVLSGAG
jgi:hypothetical protein